jgi:membrane-bound serine protease (ClpP class)
MDPFALNLIMILCFIVGSGLIILEAFIPGFGVAGISGIILEVVALWATWRLHGVTTALIALFAVLVLIGFAIFLSYRSAMNGRLSRSPLVLKETEAAGAPASPDQWIGQEGVAVTALRPAGEIDIAGVRLRAASSGDFIPKGTAVLVTGTEGDHLVIRPKA